MCVSVCLYLCVFVPQSLSLSLSLSHTLSLSLYPSPYQGLSLSLSLALSLYLFILLHVKVSLSLYIYIYIYIYFSFLFLCPYLSLSLSLSLSPSVISFFNEKRINRCPFLCPNQSYLFHMRIIPRQDSRLSSLIYWKCPSFAENLSNNLPRRNMNNNKNPPT